MLSDEIKVNDTVTFEISKIFENPDGVKMFKLGEYYFTEDDLNKMGMSSITTTTSTSINVHTKSPFDRVEKYEKYYLINIDGTIQDAVEIYNEIDETAYNTGNYCTDKKLLSQRAMHETLNRLLWRYSEENGGDNDWNTTNYRYPLKEHWYIYFNTEFNSFCTSSGTRKIQGTIYFKSDEIARSAIQDIVQPFIEKHPDFKW